MDKMDPKAFEALRKMVQGDYNKLTIAEQFQLLQLINDTEKVDPEQLKGIKELTKSIKSKMVKRDTKPATILEFLFKLSFFANNDTYMRPVADTGVLDVLYLLSSHPDPLIQRASIYVLSEISVNAENALRMMGEGSVALALRACDSKDEHTRIFGIKFCGNFLRVPEYNVTLSKYLMENPSFVATARWMNTLTKPFALKTVTRAGFINVSFECCKTSIQAIGLLCSSRPNTHKAEQLGLVADLVNYMKDFPADAPTPQRNIATLALWSLGRAYACGLSITDERQVIKVLNLSSSGAPEKLPRGTFYETQLEFVPVEAPVFRYELVNDRVEVQDPKKSLTRKCALLSCDVRESPTIKLKVCSGCRVSSYCCREHQVQDWKAGHKDRCSTQGK